MDRPKTKSLFNEVSKIVPGGIHSNIRYIEPYPYIFDKAEGSRLGDIDGNEYIDCVLNYGALILGHGDVRVINAVKDQVESGLTCDVETELSIDVSDKLHEMIPCAEMIKFSLSGTEAVLHAINIVRGYTRKEKIIKMEGGYNGWSDAVIMSVHPPLNQAGPESNPTKIFETKGVPENAKEHTLIIPYNNPEIAETIVKKHKGEIAALIVEPVVFNSGAVMPKQDYLQQLREITEDNDVLLFFDEVITGFRLTPGGGQEYFGVTPDIATFAKAMANGFPISAVAGIEEVMQVSIPGGEVGYGGVYNGSQVSVAAASATLDLIKDGSIQKELNESNVYLTKKFQEIAEEHHVKAQLIGLGGQFCVYFTDNEIVDYRSAVTSDKEKFQKFARNLLERKIYMYDGYLFHHGVCAAHTKQDLDTILAAMDDSL